MLVHGGIRCPAAPQDKGQIDPAFPTHDQGDDDRVADIVVQVGFGRSIGDGHCGHVGQNARVGRAGGEHHVRIGQQGGAEAQV